MKVVSGFCPADSLTVLKMGKESEPFRFRWGLIDERFHDYTIYGLILCVYDSP